MEYLIKSSIVILLFWLFYIIFLKKETFFQTNRLFFIFAIILSLGLPLWQIPIYKTIVIETSNQAFVNYPPNIKMTNIWDFKQMLMLLYLLGVLFFTFKYIISLISLVIFIKKSPIETENNIKIIYTHKNTQPFSFFNYIFLPKKGFTKEEFQTIIEHEKIHIQQVHSFDLILLNIIQIIQWVNPFIWFFSKILRQNLEFIADDLSKNRIISEKSYQYLLLKTATKKTAFGLHTNFNYSFIKKRIIMMQQKKSNRLNLLKYFIMLPILGVFMMSFNTKEVINYKINNEKNKILTNSQKDNFVVVISKTTTDEQLNDYQKKFEKIGMKFKYSEIKRNEKNEIISISLFLEDNKSKQKTAMFIKNAGIPISEIVLGEIEGKLFVTNQKDKNDNVKGNFINSSSSKNNSNLSNALIVKNGKIITNKEFKKIDKNKIKTIKIYKGKEGQKKYGKKGKNGVIEIYTSNSKKVDEQSGGDTGYVSYKGEQYFYKIKNNKITFYTKFGEQIRNKKLIKKLKEILEKKTKMM